MGEDLELTPVANVAFTGVVAEEINRLNRELKEAAAEIERLRAELRQSNADRDLYKKWMHNYKLAFQKGQQRGGAW
jgi:hypothetical protein